jgi:hypothetical protein
MIMNRIFKIASIALAGVAALASCQKTPEFITTEVGPDMTVNSCTESTYMGAEIKFSVDVNDKDFALSTLKAKLLYDETEVSNVTIRTKENGTYEGTILAPLYADIPNGIASVVFASQNVGMGLSYDTVYVALKRPDFPTLTLKTEDGTDYELTKVNDDEYKYELTGSFPEKVKGHVVTPAINDEGEVISLGWDGSALAAGHVNPIPFTAGMAGEYTISVDLMKLTASPMGAGSVVAVQELKQGQVMDFGDVVDLNNWTIDYDFFEVNDDFTEVKFRAVDGYYQLSYDAEKMWIKVEPVDAGGNLLTLAADGAGAPWVIGANIGKPVIGPGWNTTDGAYPLAQVADKVYQITFTAPGQVAVSGADFKFFHQKGWGGEFLKSDYAEINIAPAFTMTDSGNIQCADLEGGKSYKLILDLTGGVKAAKVSYEEVVVPVNMLDIKVNGVNAMKLSNSVYKVMAVEVAQNSIISFSGIDNPLDWYVDPDHFELTAEGLKFKAVSGYYSFELDLANQFVTPRRVKADGKAATYKDEGAITMMGWGVGHPCIATPLAWESGALITLAEISDGVYQFTGVAGEATDTTKGVRWQYDSELSFKFFGQAGWGDEWGTVTLTEEAQKYLAVYGNVELLKVDEASKERHPLELGATYVMTVTNCTSLKDSKFDCTIDFKKL